MFNKMTPKKWLLVAVLSCLFLFLLVLVVFKKTSFIDTNFYNLLISLRTPSLDSFFKFMTKCGNTISVIAIIGIMALLLHNKDSIFLIVNNGLAAGFNVVIKHLVKRPRPNILRLISESGYSFPSDHAMNSLALYGFLIYLVRKYIKNNVLKNILTVALIIFIMLIGLSRVYVGVHYTTDILAGWLLSSIILILLLNCKWIGDSNDKTSHK